MAQLLQLLPAALAKRAMEMRARCAEVFAPSKGHFNTLVHSQVNQDCFGTRKYWFREDNLGYHAQFQRPRNRTKTRIQGIGV